MLKFKQLLLIPAFCCLIQQSHPITISDQAKVQILAGAAGILAAFSVFQFFTKRSISRDLEIAKLELELLQLEVDAIEKDHAAVQKAKEDITRFALDYEREIDSLGAHDEYVFCQAALSHARADKKSVELLSEHFNTMCSALIGHKSKLTVKLNEFKAKANRADLIEPCSQILEDLGAAIIKAHEIKAVFVNVKDHLFLQDHVDSVNYKKTFAQEAKMLPMPDSQKIIAFDKHIKKVMGDQFAYLEYAQKIRKHTSILEGLIKRASRSARSEFQKQLIKESNEIVVLLDSIVAFVVLQPEYQKDVIAKPIFLDQQARLKAELKEKEQRLQMEMKEREAKIERKRQAARANTLNICARCHGAWANNFNLCLRCHNDLYGRQPAYEPWSPMRHQAPNPFGPR